MLLQIYWKKSQAKHVALSFSSDTVVVHGEEKIRRDAYDAKYANGLVFTHYRTEDVTDEETGQTYQNSFVELRIGVKTLVLASGRTFCFETDDKTAYERAASHFKALNAYHNEQLMAVYICYYGRHGFFDGEGNEIPYATILEIFDEP